MAIVTRNLVAHRETPVRPVQAFFSPAFYNDKEFTRNQIIFFEFFNMRKKLANIIDTIRCFTLKLVQLCAIEIKIQI